MALSAAMDSHHNDSSDNTDTDTNSDSHNTDTELGRTAPRRRRGDHHHHHRHHSHDPDDDMTVDTEVDSATRPSLSRSDSPPPKRPKRNPSVKCPICHEIVAPGQYQQHYRMELASLEACTSMDRTRGKRGAAIAASKQFTKGKSRGSASDNERLDLLRDIQKRRTARQNNRDANSLSTGPSRSGGHMDLDRRLVNGEDGTFLGDDDAPATCFICNERLFGSLEDINAHIDACLTNPQQPVVHNGGGGGGFHLASGTNTPTSERGGGPSGRSSAATTPNDRAADSFEEYTWAGQTRIRATALFEGGMGSLGSGSRVSNQEDIDDDLNVEDDEEDEYGDSQFTERDVVVDNVDADAEELREIVLESSVAVRRAPSSPSPSLSHASTAGGLSSSEEKRRRRMDKDVDIEDEGPDPGDKDDEEIDEDEEIDLEGDDDEDEDHRLNLMISSAFASGDTRLVIDALRSKIKHLESASKSMNAPSCLICLEPYTVPLTSIVCWHVHCEACWMKTLGSKKLCPQCQKITLPKDLRRIYL